MMPNGKGKPNCSSCNHITKVDNHYRCSYHEFDIPLIDYDVICKDFISNKYPVNNGIPDVSIMEAGKLYYYSAPNYQIIDALSSFKELNNKIIDVKIKNVIINTGDKCWVLSVSPRDENILPVIDDNCLLEIDGFEYEFKGAVYSEDKGSLKKPNRMVNIKCVYNERHPEVLIRWLNNYIDTEYINSAIEQNSEDNVISKIGYPSFMRYREDGNKLSLFPNLIFYRLMYGDSILNYSME